MTSRIPTVVTTLMAVATLLLYPGGEPLRLPGATVSAQELKQEPIAEAMARLKAARPAIEARHQQLLAARYDLSDHPARVTSTRGKPIQEGVRVRLPDGVTWEQLARMSPAEIKSRDLFPLGFLPLPHPNHVEGGMLFPQLTIDTLKAQSGRDLTRFDLAFDLPQHLLPEFPPAVFLTTRPDLGDVSQGRMVTIENLQEMNGEILNPKQLEGLRLLLTPFPQQQFNVTDDRRSEHGHLGVACLDCHVNGHTNAATHLVGDIRPQEFRHRIDTTSLRGVNVQRLFGSQRALKTVEDFTEFEQRAAYFDGDPVRATRKGVNPLERGSQVHFMAEWQELLDFPPPPKLGLDGKLDPALASPDELRGQEVFFGRGQCATCHIPPYYTDNLMHNLRTERFFTPRDINGRMANQDGPIKTFVLRGIKESAPYLHDGRLLLPANEQGEAVSGSCDGPLDRSIPANEMLRPADARMAAGQWREDSERNVRAYHVPDLIEWRDLGSYQAEFPTLPGALKKPIRPTHPLASGPVRSGPFGRRIRG